MADDEEEDEILDYVDKHVKRLRDELKAVRTDVEGQLTPTTLVPLHTHPPTHKHTHTHPHTHPPRRTQPYPTLPPDHHAYLIVRYR